MASQVLALQKCFKSISVKVHGSCDFNQLQHGDTCHPSTVVLDEERRHPGTYKSREDSSARGAIGRLTQSSTVSFANMGLQECAQ